MKWEIALRELEPEWLQFYGELDRWRRIDTFAGANGICFVCPLCFLENKRSRPGVHSVICWDPSVPQAMHPNPGRWRLVGTSFDDLSLVAGSSSVLLTMGCKAHFYVQNGRVREA